MRGLDPRIHVFATNEVIKTWMAGSSPAMTLKGATKTLSHREREERTQ